MVTEINSEKIGSKHIILGLLMVIIFFSFIAFLIEKPSKEDTLQKIITNTKVGKFVTNYNISANFGLLNESDTKIILENEDILQFINKKCGDIGKPKQIVYFMDKESFLIIDYINQKVLCDYVSEDMQEQIDLIGKNNFPKRQESNAYRVNLNDVQRNIISSESYYDNKKISSEEEEIIAKRMFNAIGSMNESSLLKEIYEDYKDEASPLLEVKTSIEHVDISTAPIEELTSFKGNSLCDTFLFYIFDEKKEIYFLLRAVPYQNNCNRAIKLDSFGSDGKTQLKDIDYPIKLIVSRSLGPNYNMTIFKDYLEGDYLERGIFPFEVYINGLDDKLKFK